MIIVLSNVMVTDKKKSSEFNYLCVAHHFSKIYSPKFSNPIWSKITSLNL